MNVLIAMVLLAQAAPWVRFEICQLDLTTVPPTAVRSRDHDVFHIRADRIVAVAEIRPKPQGPQCAAIHTANARTYVLGTPSEIMRRLNKE